MAQEIDKYNLGISCPGGTEAYAHIIRAHTEINTDYAFINIDASNAFNSIDRDVIEEMAKKIPPYLPMGLKALYCCIGGQKMINNQDDPDTPVHPLFYTGLFGSGIAYDNVYSHRLLTLREVLIATQQAMPCLCSNCKVNKRKYYCFVVADRLGGLNTKPAFVIESTHSASPVLAVVGVEKHKKEEGPPCRYMLATPNRNDGFLNWFSTYVNRFVKGIYTVQNVPEPYRIPRLPVAPEGYYDYFGDFYPQFIFRGNNEPPIKELRKRFIHYDAIMEYQLNQLYIKTTPPAFAKDKAKFAQYIKVMRDLNNSQQRYISLAPEYGLSTCSYTVTNGIHIQIGAYFVPVLSLIPKQMCYHQQIIQDNTINKMKYLEYTKCSKETGEYRYNTRLVWIYRIRIWNTGETYPIAQLYTRHWIIKQKNHQMIIDSLTDNNNNNTSSSSSSNTNDDDNDIDEIRGEGVIGLLPVVRAIEKDTSSSSIQTKTNLARTNSNTSSSSNTTSSSSSSGSTSSSSSSSSNSMNKIEVPPKVFEYCSITHQHYVDQNGSMQGDFTFYPGLLKDRLPSDISSLF